MAIPSQSADQARVKARHQLRRVLLLLAILDTSVLVVVIGLAVAWDRFQFPVAYFVALVVGAVSGILLVRVALGIRLKRRAGDV